MKTIMVDDEKWAMTKFRHECEKSTDFELAGLFDRASDALAYAEQNDVEFALLDIEMPEMSGLELGDRIRKLHPEAIIVYVTAHSEFLLDSIKQRADYYVLKPYGIEDVEAVLKRAKLLSGRLKKRVYINALGRFNVFVDNKSVSFKNTKAKELLALCTDRCGGVVSMEEAIDKLWEDKLYDKNTKCLYRHAVTYLKKLFMSYDLGEVFQTCRGGCNINKTLVDCDYYDMLNSGKSFDYESEYLIDYSWGEETLARLMAK